VAGAESGLQAAAGKQGDGGGNRGDRGRSPGGILRQAEGHGRDGSVSHAARDVKQGVGRACKARAGAGAGRRPGRRASGAAARERDGQVARWQYRGGVTEVHEKPGSSCCRNGTRAEAHRGGQGVPQPGPPGHGQGAKREKAVAHVAERRGGRAPATSGGAKPWRAEQRKTGTGGPSGAAHGARGVEHSKGGASQRRRTAGKAGAARPRSKRTRAGAGRSGRGSRREPPEG